VAELEEFAKKTLAANCLFVIDEAYHLFGAATAVELIKKYENVVIARTFSKGFGVPSIRLGYLISNADNMNVLTKTRFAHESNALSNAVAEYLLDHYDMVEAYNGKVMKAREELKGILAKQGIRAIGRTGNFLLLDLGSEDRARAFVNTLRDEKTIYMKGPWSAPWNRYVTITLGPMEVMQRFVDATAEFCRTEKAA
jgi:histidinol-phosphate aminotransferase